MKPFMALSVLYFYTLAGVWTPANGLLTVAL